METDTPIWMWAVFFAVVLSSVVIDLGLHRKERKVIGVREALIRSAGFFALAMAFNAFVYVERGHEPASQFFTGYLIELSLSVDNLFVFLLIFNHFVVSREYQLRVLLWGILGAILMRGLMIWLGDTLIEQFAGIMYLFGGFLVLTGLKMLREADSEPDLSNNTIINFMQKRFRITKKFEKEHFFVRRKGKLWITPLFMVLVLIEISDLVFAVDSIPAIFAVTNDGFVMFTSNIFAILGLRSIYFALAAFIHRFEYLKYGLSVILVFIGGKMLVNHYMGDYVVSTELSLLVVVLLLGASVWFSIIKTSTGEQMPTGWVPGSRPKTKDKEVD